MLEFMFQMSVFVLFILIYFMGCLVIVAIKIIINTNNTELFCFSSKEVKTQGCTSGPGVVQIRSPPAISFCGKLGISCEDQITSILASGMSLRHYKCQ